MAFPDQIIWYQKNGRHSTAELQAGKPKTRGHAAGGAVGWRTALQTEKLRVRFPKVSLEFFICIILPAALWPRGLLSL